VDVRIHPLNLRKSSDIARLGEVAARIDVLVNNAGDIPGGSLEKVDETAWRHAWELKVFGHINLTRIVYAAVKARGHGEIINDIGAAGERFDFDYCRQHGQCRADGVYPRAGRAKPRRQRPGREHQSGSGRNRSHCQSH
jgi:NAD(P)-dependent dehydrogenase (short-subunit alcohol dehydrogenase family)